MELNDNQAALILEVSDQGEISVEVAVNERENEDRNIATAICQVIAMKLVNDEHFQSEIMAALEGEESEHEDFGDGGIEQ
ncbi:MAG: twitching motility protein [Nitrospirota bacterium]